MAGIFGVCLPARCSLGLQIYDQRIKIAFQTNSESSFTMVFTSTTNFRTTHPRQWDWTAMAASDATVLLPEIVATRNSRNPVGSGSVALIVSPKYLMIRRR
ncbi:unnamed protein product [Prorocentrum cordatum]|uniref:Uncharacterized protein n=1 Tax=Prorocentrum cordatum TaxID=2364126 RepID=A0ABN9PYX6_9DINO|nr:unnamed protein product [Polarella glacialis]